MKTIFIELTGVYCLVSNLSYVPQIIELRSDRIVLHDLGWGCSPKDAATLKDGMLHGLLQTVSVWYSTAKAEGGICGDPMKLADACCDEKKLTLT